jgi:hypothetical protein
VHLQFCAALCPDGDCWPRCYLWKRTLCACLPCNDAAVPCTTCARVRPCHSATECQSPLKTWTATRCGQQVSRTPLNQLSPWADQATHPYEGLLGLANTASSPLQQPVPLAPTKPHFATALSTAGVLHANSGRRGRSPPGTLSSPDTPVVSTAEW